MIDKSILEREFFGVIVAVLLITLYNMSISYPELEIIEVTGLLLAIIYIVGESVNLENSL